MKRFTVLGLLTGLLTVVAASAGDPGKGKPADGPEVKKDAPDPEKGKADKDRPEPEKGKGKKGEEGDEAKKAKELVKRIAKGMQRSEKRLSDKDPRETTQQVQRDVVKDLDELIKQLQKENEKNQGASSASGGSSGSGSSAGSRAQAGGSGQQGGSPQGGNAGQKGGQGGEGSKSQSKGGGQGKAGSQGKGKDGGKGGEGKQQGKGKGKDGKDGPEKLGKNKKGGKNGGSGLGQAKDSKARQSPLGDVYREAWGHLEKMRRQEMDAYARERYMERYRELLQEYYNAVGKLRRQTDE